MIKNTLVFFVIILIFIGCNKESVNEPTPDPPKKMGTISISSLPAKAKIFLEGVDTKETTPSSLQIEPGVYQISLQLDDYYDTLFQATVFETIPSAKSIALVSRVFPQVSYIKTEHILSFNATFDYNVFIKEVKITKPNGQLQTIYPGYKYSTQNIFPIQSYATSNGNIEGDWNFVFSGYMVSDTSHFFVKEVSREVK